MANTFKRKYSSSVGTTATVIGDYQVQANVQTTVIGMSCSNTSASQVNVDAYLEAPNGDVVYLIKSAPVPSGGSLVIVGGDQKVVMETGDKVKIVSDTASSLDVVMSILEIG